jgi:hypothetical protein
MFHIQHSGTRIVVAVMKQNFVKFLTHILTEPESRKQRVAKIGMKFKMSHIKETFGTDVIINKRLTQPMNLRGNFNSNKISAAKVHKLAYSQAPFCDLGR